MRILVTGAAGFIGAAVCERLLDEGHQVVGVDNINDYYDPSLKMGRLDRLGISGAAEEWHKPVRSSRFEQFTFIRVDLKDTAQMDRIFDENRFDIVINLAAQAGVRYSLENPRAYIDSNICGFINVLEGCRRTDVGHLVYASSSSVYGLNSKVPFSEHDGVDHPVSLYAATKKSNEMMAHTYSHLFGLPTTGLRFFTVYGPWGRPDMSPFLFMDAILHERPVKLFNHGDMLRDFTYIDDIVEGVVRIAMKKPEADPDWDSVKADPATSSAPYRIYNIGNHQPVKLMDYIECIEKAIGREARKEFCPMQPGDVYQTCADTSELAEATGFTPNTPLAEGIKSTVNWFRAFYNI